MLRWNRSCRVGFVKALEFDTLTVDNQIWQFFGDLKILLLFTATKAPRAVNGGIVPGLVRFCMAYKNWGPMFSLWWIRLLQGHWCRHRKCTRPENCKGLKKIRLDFNIFRLWWIKLLQGDRWRHRKSTRPENNNDFFYVIIFLAVVHIIWSLM